ncbi:hypothetical protein F4808DRAFT_427092, partial [Astrocystis sublimbata]
MNYHVDKRTSLSWAAEKGHQEIAQLLLYQGASIEPEGMPIRYWPLLSAIKAGHTEIVRLLLDRGAEFEIDDDD